MSNGLHISIHPTQTAPVTSSPTSILPTSTLPPAPKLPAPNTLFTTSGERELIDSAVLQSGSVLSGLLAAVAAQLLTFFKDDSNFEQPKSDARDAILTLTYVSLLSSIFATMASLALTLGGPSSPNVRSLYTWLVGYIFRLWVQTLAIVTASTVASIVVYIATNEQRKITIAVCVVVAYVTLFLVWYSFGAISAVTLEVLQRRRDRRQETKGQAVREEGHD